MNHTILKNIYHMIPHMMTNIILTVTFIAIFLVIFFFSYVSNVEKTIVLTNVKYTINQILDNIILFFPEKIKKKILNTEISVNKSDDDSVKKINAGLKLTSYKYLGIFVLIAIILAYLITFLASDNLNDSFSKFYESICEAFGITIFIGLVEFTFLKCVTTNFLSSNPNLINLKILEILNK